MNKVLDTAVALDPVDRFANEILKHPERAADIKERLRRQIGLGAPRPFPADVQDPADLDDLWDNVPV